MRWGGGGGIKYMVRGKKMRGMEEKGKRKKMRGMGVKGEGNGEKR